MPSILQVACMLRRPHLMTKVPKLVGAVKVALPVPSARVVTAVKSGVDTAPLSSLSAGVSALLLLPDREAAELVAPPLATALADAGIAASSMTISGPGPAPAAAVA